MPRLLDLFCGRWGWSRAFSERGWECVGIDLVEPPDIPNNCTFIKANILDVHAKGGSIFIYASDPLVHEFKVDFICASSPCEEFSVFGMKNFHPNPPPPELGIKLFNYTQALCEVSGIPWIMENVRNAQDFVGDAAHHCGPFYLWGCGVPPLMPQGIKKGFKMGNGATARRIKESGGRAALIEYRKKMDCWHSAKSPQRIANTAKVATIPPELATCVADYAERILERIGI